MRGQEILPDHLDNIQKGDIVLMTSPFKGLEQPWLSSRTVDWLIKDRAIKMIGFGYPGIEWQYDLKVAAPKNSPIRRMFLGANIPIAHPLVNIETLSSDRVFYYGMPLNVPKLEASFVRAVAFEPQNQEDDA
jgi:kynurenine formamidase